jgi:hypothetical protein
MESEQAGKPRLETSPLELDCLNLQIEELELIIAPGNGWSV